MDIVFCTWSRTKKRNESKLGQSKRERKGKQLRIREAALYGAQVLYTLLW